MQTWVYWLQAQAPPSLSGTWSASNTRQSLAPTELSSWQTSIDFQHLLSWHLPVTLQCLKTHPCITPLTDFGSLSIAAISTTTSAIFFPKSYRDQLTQTVFEDSLWQNIQFYHSFTYNPIINMYNSLCPCISAFFFILCIVFNKKVFCLQ